jgi:hypothetical protein
VFVSALLATVESTAIQSLPRTPEARLFDLISPPFTEEARAVK